MEKRKWKMFWIVFFFISNTSKCAQSYSNPYIICIIRMTTIQIIEYSWFHRMRKCFFFSCLRFVLKINKMVKPCTWSVCRQNLNRFWISFTQKHKLTLVHDSLAADKLHSNSKTYFHTRKGKARKRTSGTEKVFSTLFVSGQKVEDMVYCKIFKWKLINAMCKIRLN